MKPNYLKLYVYIGKEVALSVALTFGFFFFMFFINNILLLAQRLLSKAVPPSDVLILLVFMLPSAIALAAPFATLAGVLMAIGRLSSDNEVMALQSLGISFPRMFIPIFVLGLGFTTASFMVNDVLMPLGTINFSKHFQEVITANPELELSTYTIKKYEDTTLATGKVENKVIEDLVLFDRNDKQDFRTIWASKAWLSRDEDKAGVLSINLEDAVAIEPKLRIRGDFSYFTSESMTYNFLLKDITTAIRRPEPNEMSAVDVFKEIKKKEEDLEKRRAEARLRNQVLRWEMVQTLSAKLRPGSPSTQVRQSLETDLQLPYETITREETKATYDRSLVIHQMEFFQKFTIPLSCVLFALLGFPIAIFNKRSGRMLGFVIALIISFLYWSLLLGVRNVSQMGTENPFFIMFAPNLILLVLGSVFLFLKART